MPDRTSHPSRHRSPERAGSSVSGVDWAWISKSGRENTDSRVGLYAGEPESYERFEARFRPVILRCHGLTAYPEHGTGGAVDLRAPRPRRDRPEAVSTRIRLARNLRGFHFPSAMSRSERRAVLGEVADALRDVPGRLIEMADMTRAGRPDLRRAPWRFDDRDRFMRSAGILNHWPEGRAVFVADDGRGGLWINEEDHLRIFAIVPGYDLAGAAAAVSRLLETLERRLAFATSPWLGYLTSCPSNLGTALRASVLMPCTPVEVRRLRAGNLELRGTRGERSRALDGVYAVSNRQRLGLSEADILARLDATIAKAVTGG